MAIEYSAFIAKIIKGMTPLQKEAVLATADAADGRVPHTVHQRTVDALHSKNVIREVNNPNGGFNWCVLTYNGKRVAKALAERNAKKAGALPPAEAVAALRGTDPKPTATEPDTDTAPAEEIDAARERSSRLAERVRNNPDPTDPEWRGALAELGEALDEQARIDPVTRKAIREPDTAGDVLRAALEAHGITPERDEYSYRIPLSANGHALYIADRAPMTEHASSGHTGWVVALYDGDGAPVEGLEPLYTSGNGTELVDCLTDSAAAAATIAHFLPGATPGAILGTTLTARGIPFHLETDPAWGALLVVDLDRLGGTGTLEIADRASSLFHPVDEHTGWSVFRKDANGEFVPPSCTPVYISGDGQEPVYLFDDTESVVELVENYAFRH